MHQAPSAAIAGLIERGSRFERSAQAAAAASVSEMIITYLSTPNSNWLYVGESQTIYSLRSNVALQACQRVFGHVP